MGERLREAAERTARRVAEAKARGLARRKAAWKRQAAKDLARLDPAQQVRVMQALESRARAEAKRQAERAKAGLESPPATG